MTDQQYQHLDLVALYDALNPLGRDSDYFIAACAPAPRAVLDLGCGTGLLTAALAKLGHRVTGVDPAGDMLTVAKQHDPERLVTWIEADACRLELARKFGRVIATGHVFQVFLTAADQQAFLRTAARHLTPDGQLIFDSRNPTRAPWQNWTPDATRRRLDHPAFGEIETWHTVTDVTADARSDGPGSIVRFTTTYRFLARDQEVTSDSALAFPSLAALENRLQEAGLEILTVQGDWDSQPFTPESREIILAARRSHANL